MDVFRKSEIEMEGGLPDNFVGEVHLQRLERGQHKPFLRLYRVEFAQEARTNWHFHDTLQILYVLEGLCRLGGRAGKLQTLAAGDMARIEPLLEHFHGADGSGAMVHLAVMIGEEAETKWLEPVSDKAYGI